MSAVMRHAKAQTNMASENTPTPGDGDAVSADPIDAMQAWLDRQSADDPMDSEQSDPKSSQPTDKPDDGVPGKTTEPQFTTAHLAQFLGIDENMVDVDEDGQPTFKTKIDGQEKNAKFKDFLTDHQKHGSADNRLREAAEKDKAAERKLQEAEQAVQAKLNEQSEAVKQVAQLALVMSHDLQQERQSINWDALWQENPAQARALERRFDERQGKINQSLGQLRQRDLHIKQQAAVQQQELAAKNQQTQAKRLVEMIPEWRDADTFNKERGEILNWLERSGFDPADVDLNKASQVYLIRKSWQRDTLEKSKPEIENKLRQAPKLVKPGTPTNTSVKDVTVKGLQQHIKKSGGKDTKALADLLMTRGLA